MHFTQNPIGSDDQLDLQDNAISFDYAMNSPAALWQDRFGKQHKTVQQALKDVGFKPAGFDFVSGGTLGIGDRDKCVFYPTDGYWYSWNGKLPYVVPANSSPTPGGKKGWGVIEKFLDADKLIFSSVQDMKIGKTHTGKYVNLSIYPEGTKVSWLGYYAASDGGSNWGILKKGVHTEDGGYILGLSGLLYVQANLKGSRINVRKFGAFGDGITDDTAKFIAASNYIHANHPDGSISISGGTFLVGDLVLRCSLYSADRSIIKNTNSANTGKGVRYSSANPPAGKLVIEGVVFDGGVSPDPVDWAADYDSFTGNIGLVLSGITNGTKILRCEFVNAHWSGLCLEQCDNVLISKCRTNKTRGNFGDGFYCHQCTNVLCVSSSAYDFTRIGFVSDCGCANITVDGFNAEYGHNQSRNYGGVEFNRAVWLENTQNGKILNCNSRNTEGGSFTIAFGGMTPTGGNRATGLISNCTSYDSGSHGIVVSPFGVAGNIAVNDCKVFNAALAYQVSGTPAAGINVIKFTRCHGEATGEHDNSCVFAFDTGASGDVDVTIDNCTGKLISHSFVDDINNHAGDFGGYLGMIGKLTVNNYINQNSYCVAKINQISNLYLGMTFENTDFKLFHCPVFSYSDTYFRNCKVDTFRLGYNIAANIQWPTLTLRDTTFKGRASVFSYRIRGNAKIIGDNSLLILTYTTPNINQLPLVDAQLDIDKDVAARGPGIIVNAAPGVITRNIIRGTWVNTKGTQVATAAGSFFHVTNTNTFFYGFGLLKDSTVTDYCSENDTLAAIAVQGGTSIVLH